MKLSPLFLCLVFLVTGCIKLDFHLKIKEDGSGVLQQSIKLDFDPSLLEEAGEGAEGALKMNPLNDMTADIEKNGGKLIKQTDSEVVAEYPFKRIEELDLAKLMDRNGATKPDWVNEHRNYLFWSDHQLKFSMDLSEAAPPQEEGEVADPMANKFAQMFMDGMLDLTMRVTLPSVPASHNADEDYGQMLVWYLKPGQNTEANVSYRTVNWPLIAGASAFGGVLAGSLGTLMIQGLSAKPATAQ